MKDPRPDYLLRMPLSLELAWERRHKADRVWQLRRAALVALLLYNLFILPDMLLMPDLARWILLLRAAVVSPFILALYAIGPRLSMHLREFILLPSMIACGCLPLAFMAASSSTEADFALADIFLNLVFGNLVLVLRFRFALVFTAVTCLLTVLALLHRHGAGDALAMVLIFQVVAVGVFLAHANWQMESARCKAFIEGYGAMRRADAAERAGARFERIANHDELTGIANRRHLQQTLDGWIGAGRSVAVMMADVDHFKRYNDALGHPAGDQCLRRIAASLSTFALESSGLAARYGGEEFVVALPDVDGATARRLADELVHRIAAEDIPHPARTDGFGRVTVSVGCAHAGAGRQAPRDTLVFEADGALYAAKEAGRNRAVTL